MLCEILALILCYMHMLLSGVTKTTGRSYFLEIKIADFEL